MQRVAHTGHTGRRTKDDRQLVEPMENCGAGGEVEQFEELESSSRGKRTSKHA